MHTQGGWPASITVTPGRNGSEMPFGQASAVGLRSVNGWVSMHKREYDYGAIILPPSYTRNQSAFGFASMQDAALRGKKLNHAGYSGDKPRGTLWYSGRPRGSGLQKKSHLHNTVQRLTAALQRAAVKSRQLKHEAEGKLLWEP